MKLLESVFTVTTVSLSILFHSTAIIAQSPGNVKVEAPSPAASPSAAPAATGPFGQEKSQHVEGTKIFYTSFKVAENSATRFLLDQAVLAEKAIGNLEGDEIRKKDPILRKLIRSILDLNAIGKGALVNHWAELGKTKKGQAVRDRYSKLFTELVEENYLERVRIYIGGQYNITFSGEETKASSAVVKARIKKKDVDVLVEFVCVKNGANWIVVDSRLDEISLQETYRGSFNRIIRKNGGVDKGLPELLRVMEKRLNELRSGKATHL